MFKTEVTALLNNGSITTRDDIIEFFNSSDVFGSLFVLANSAGEKRVVCEIKNINDGLDQISFVPLGDEDVLLFEEGEELSLLNEAGNINCNTQTLKVHNKSWLTAELPKKLRMINQRSEARLALDERHKQGTTKISSYGEDGVKPLMNHEGEVLDFSSSGVSFKIEASRLDGYYRGDHVEVMVTEKYPFLSRVRGKVVYKSIAHMLEPGRRFYRLGIKFDKPVNLSSLQ